MEMALLVSVVAALLAIFTVYRTAKEIIKNMTALDADRRKAFRKFILTGSTLAGVLIVIMVGATAWIAMEKEDITEMQAGANSKLQEAQAGLNKANAELAAARRRSGEDFSKAYADAVKRADEAATKAAGFDNEDNRKKLGDKFDDQQKAMNSDALAKLQAFVDLVEKGRPTSEGLRELLSIGAKIIDMMSSGGKAIEDALGKGDLAGATKALAALKEAQDSEGAKVKSAMDAALAKPAAAAPAAKSAAAAPAPAVKSDAPAKADAAKK
ncbi:MAG: hypothetical protein EXR28_07025 [Betaproteobacteria bacterium]|nr:hypothetical protein [Betaproteobacteria bacterium]